MTEPTPPSEDQSPADAPTEGERATQRLVRDVAALEVDPAPPARAVQAQDDDTPD